MARLNHTAVSAPDAIAAAKNQRAPESVLHVAYFLGLMLLYRLKRLHARQYITTAQSVDERNVLVAARSQSDSKVKTTRVALFLRTRMRKGWLLNYLSSGISCRPLCS